MQNMTEIRNPKSDRGWGIENNSLVHSKLNHILTHEFGGAWDNLSITSMQKSSATKLNFAATISRTFRNGWGNFETEMQRIMGEMILSISFECSRRTAPALEMQSMARVYYVKVK